MSDRASYAQNSGGQRNMNTDSRATVTGTNGTAKSGAHKADSANKDQGEDVKSSMVSENQQKTSSNKSTEKVGLVFKRYFTRAGHNPFDEVEWELRDATIKGAGGEVYFEQKGVEFPAKWSQTATNVVVQKYFRGTLGTPEREYSVRQMISRVAYTIHDWGVKDGYFHSAEDAMSFREELVHLLVNQKMAFNSPVWFNLGVEDHPQCSACFINSVNDSMESILDLAKTEGMLFKYGSGAGSNLSELRSSAELLNGGGTASGPVSFMKGFDSFAGAIKSGGKTRRAAKMVILNASHPDIITFVDSKRNEEEKAWALIDAGYDGAGKKAVRHKVLRAQRQAVGAHLERGVDFPGIFIAVEAIVHQFGADNNCDV